MLSGAVVRPLEQKDLARELNLLVEEKNPNLDAIKNKLKEFDQSREEFAAFQKDTRERFPQFADCISSLPDRLSINGKVTLESDGSWKHNALYRACRDGKLEVVKILIEHLIKHKEIISLDESDVLLTMAMDIGHAEIVRLLWQNKFLLNSNQAVTLLQVQSLINYVTNEETIIQIMQILSKPASSTPTHGITLFPKATHWHDRAPSEWYEEALRWAIEKQRSQVVEYLILNHTVDVNKSVYNRDLGNIPLFALIFSRNRLNTEEQGLKTLKAFCNACREKGISITDILSQHSATVVSLVMKYNMPSILKELILRQGMKIQATELLQNAIAFLNAAEKPKTGESKEQESGRSFQM